MASMWTGLVFLHGHITDFKTARQLADRVEPIPALQTRGRRWRWPRTDGLLRRPKTQLPCP
jgi:hypothetical protein